MTGEIAKMGGRQPSQTSSDRSFPFQGRQSVDIEAFSCFGGDLERRRFEQFVGPLDRPAVRQARAAECREKTRFKETGQQFRDDD